MEKDAVKEPFWSLPVDEALTILESSREGLGAEEARIRRERFGRNMIPERASATLPGLIARQFASPFILVLVCAGGATVVLREWIETGVIFAAVAVNAALGFYQEYKAESALARLHSYIHTRARMRRPEGERECDAEELVPGDILRLQTGDQVPADARVIFSRGLGVDEAVLTGESLPVAKDVAALPPGTGLAERASMLYRGTLVLEGVADAVVTATGSETEFGRIARLIGTAARTPTPLERAIARFSARAGAALAALVAVLFGIGIWAGHGIFETFLIAVAVAVSAVPEGLPVALTVILAVGVERLARRRAVVRRLLAAETLGSTTLILTDKTGTLTQAKMELAAVIPYGGSGHTDELLASALRNTDVVVENPGEPPERWKIFGRPIETALVRGAALRGISAAPLAARAGPHDQLPFNSTRKFSVTVWPQASGFRTIIFGAPDILLPFTHLPQEEAERVRMELDTRAASGERVLGVAVKESAHHEKMAEGAVFRNFRFLGFLAFRDPLRAGVPAAIGRMRQAGVRTVIMTGDHRGTAEAIARSLGMIDGAGAVLTGDDLRYLRREEWVSRSREVSVWARVTPEQKVQILEFYQRQGEVVAMTGDGVNDAPALERADIGVALGSGTEVAKSAADLVLLDDSFETIVAAIEEGRRILDNIRKVIVYLLSGALDELLLIGGALVAGIALPLTALQILFVNFFTDSFPALALAFEEGIDGLGSKPRTLDRNLFDRAVRFQIVVIGISTSALLFLLYYFLLARGFPPAVVRTFTFASFATYTLFLSFSVRSLERSVFTYNPFSNRYLSVGAGFGVLLTAGAVYLPAGQRIFDTVPLSLPWLVAVAGVGILNILAVEFGKWILRTGTLRGGRKD